MAKKDRLQTSVSRKTATRVKEAADAFGLSISNFIAQAVDVALGGVDARVEDKRNYTALQQKYKALEAAHQACKDKCDQFQTALQMEMETNKSLKATLRQRNREVETLKSRNWLERLFNKGVYY